MASVSSGSLEGLPGQGQIQASFGTGSCRDPGSRPCWGRGGAVQHAQRYHPLQDALNRDGKLFLSPLEFDYNPTGLRLDELIQGAKSVSWMAWNREKDSVSTQSFLVLQLDRPGLNPSFATS